MNRARFRQKQSELASKIRDYETKLQNPQDGPQFGAELVEEANNLCRDTQETREAAVDAEIFGTIVSVSKKAIANVTGPEVVITHQELLNAVRDKFSLTRDGLSELGKNAYVFSKSINKTSNPLSFMLGPIFQEKVMRKAAKPRTRQETFAEETVKEVVNNSKEKTDSFHEKMQKVLLHKLREHSGMNLVKFLFNPKSFTQTVENIFEFSFLVKDGWAGVRQRKDKFPIVQTCEPDASVTKHNVFVFKITYEKYIKLMKLLDINEEDESIIPHRTSLEYSDVSEAQKAKGVYQNLINKEN
eukprot:snap_masked-scaffold_3-processed-gene-9.22-mRNA-1 protein AED:1.00 eAED:1.00 QI:0/0/0/0/1/1/2/0/299